MTSKRPLREPANSFLELHWGGVHVVVERVPYRLLAMIGSAVSALGAGVWFGGR
ncbi:hypothetical protein [Streptomyces sp. NPDC056010]|uniref:hypothetical protein n=1 Tax=Streptomyces sp. NPDC056010 TaxID=3345679 RepID=UPI0035E24AB6